LFARNRPGPAAVTPWRALGAGALVVAWIVFVALTPSDPIGFDLLYPVAFGFAIAVLFLLWTTAHGPARIGAPTGRTWFPRNLPPPPAPEAVASWSAPAVIAPEVVWRGRVNCPGALWRAHTLRAELELDGHELELRGRVTHTPPLRSTPEGIDAVYPVRRFGQRGIAILPEGRHAFYFFSSRAREVLLALAAAGFPVSWDERRDTW
jgi:hypothetical protein